MTYEEVKEKLEDMRNSKRLCLRIQKEINLIRDNYDALTCPLGSNSPGRAQLSKPTERLALRLIGKQDEFEAELERMMDLEDELLSAINTLPAREKDIIMGYYMHDKTHDELARECSYSLRSINYIKKKATYKMTRQK